MDFALIAFGLGVGVLVGMTGIGGGSLMTPMLILVFGVTPVTAIGTDLAYAAVTKTVGGWKHLRQKTVDIPLSSWMALGSVPAAIGGVWVLGMLEEAAGRDFDDLVIAILAGALLVTGAATLVRAFLKRMHERERDTIELERRHKIAAVALGLAVGFVLGVTSAGSGALIAVGLILLFRLTPTRVVGTDVFHAAILLWAAGLAHVTAGNVDFALAGTILLGSVPGVWLGSHWSVRVEPAVLRTTLAVVLIGAGLALLIKAGLDIPLVVIAPVPGGCAGAAGRDDRAIPAPAGTPALPDALDAVGGQAGVGAHELKTLGLRLGDQEAVEGIAVMPGEVLDGLGVDGRDRKGVEAEASERPAPPVLDRQLSDRALDGDLPYRGGAHHHPVALVLEGQPRGLAHARPIAQQQPDDHVRVDEQAPHA